MTTKARDEHRLMVAPTHEWALAAACRDMDPEVFESAGAANPEAVAACKRCPIRALCLEEELRLNSGAKEGQFGYRGGTTSAERVAILRARKAAAKAAAESVTA